MNRNSFLNKNFALKLQAILGLSLLLLILMACSDENPTSTAATRTGAPSLNQTSGAVGLGSPATAKINAVPTATSTIVPSPVPTNTPAPPATPTPPVTKGGTISSALLYDGLTLHPYKRNNESGSQFTALLYSAALTRRDPNTLELIPGAAASWSVDNAALTVTYKLKDGLRWSDGQALTSADYMWTFLQLRKPENGWPYLNTAFYNAADPNSDGIENMAAPDPKTLIVKLHALSYDLAARADVIEPLPRQTWEGKDWNDPAKNPEINKPSVVSGPWLLKEWKPGEKITFAANDNSSLYPRPRLDGLSFQIVPDSATALERLKNGELDFFSPEAAEQNQFEKLTNVQAYRWTPAHPTWEYLGFNFRRPQLQDRALRQALAYATDRKTIIDKLAYGLARPLFSDVMPWHPYFTPNVPRYDFSVEAAQRVLKDAGYTLKDGRLVNPAGIPLSVLKLAYNSPSPLHEGIAKLLTQSFNALGLQVEIISLDYDNYVKFITGSTSDYDLFLGGWSADVDPEQFGDMWNNVPQLNSGAYASEKLTGLYDSAEKEPDARKRKDLLAQVQKLEAEELPYIYLYAQLGWIDVNKKVAGFSTSFNGPAGNLYTDWFVGK